MESKDLHHYLFGLSEQGEERIEMDIAKQHMDVYIDPTQKCEESFLETELFGVD